MSVCVDLVSVCDRVEISYCLRSTYVLYRVSVQSHSNTEEFLTRARRRRIQVQYPRPLPTFGRLARSITGTGAKIYKAGMDEIASAQPIAPLDVLSKLARMVATSYGPFPSDKLVLTAHGKAVLTSSGTTILANVVSQQPSLRLVMDAADAHVRKAGDGSKTYILMLDTLLSMGAAEAGTAASGPAPRMAHTSRTRRGRLVQDVLPNTLMPCWRRQAITTQGADEAALRRDAKSILRTALGAHLGTTASTALIAALLSATLPSLPRVVSGVGHEGAAAVPARLAPPLAPPAPPALPGSLTWHGSALRCGHTRAASSSSQPEGQPSRSRA